MSTRRHVLRGGAALGVAAVGALAPTTASGAVVDRRLHAVALRRTPFTLGVASGDPVPDGVVFWTRLALDPTAEDGTGGMPARPVDVTVQVASDEAFRTVVHERTVRALPRSAHSVHVEIEGLRPGREYWYRFRVGRHVSRVGRTSTSPAAGSMPRALTMAFASCAQYEHGYFTAYRRLAEDRPDLVLHLGDYQYEYTANDYVAPAGNVRNHEGPETVDLASYRQRHAQYKADLDLQEAHAVAPWLVVWDDHEVDNNWAGTVPEDPLETVGFGARRAAAFQAYYENMPLRRSSLPRGDHMQLYRRLHWGRLASFHMLDTRQFRDDQGCGDGYRPTARRRSTRTARSSGRRRSGGCSTGSDARAPGGTCSASRSSSPSATVRRGRSRRSRWTAGTATRRRGTGSPAAGWTPGSATPWS